MATVTVAGASGTITLPFKSQANASLAQQLADQISAAITGGGLIAASYNAAPLPPSPSVPGGSLGEQVIGDNAPTATSPASIQNPSGYPALVVNASNPVTVNGAPSQGPYSIIGGNGGLTFYGQGSFQGGSIFLGGGQNVLTGNDLPTGAMDATNGGLIGDWTIGIGAGATGTDLIRLASGNDTIFVGSQDTVATGGANTLIMSSDADPRSSTVFLGAGKVTYFGGSDFGDLILGGGVATGDDVIVLGRGGNGTVVAGTGNTTLVGGGDGDLMFADTNGARQQLWASGNETLLGGGTSSDTFFGFSGISTTGNVFMTAANGTGNNEFWAGSGNDTIWTGLGNDTVFFFADHTTHADSVAAGNDVILGFNPNSTLWIYGYANATFGSSAAGVTLTLSDGTQLTFQGITDPTTIKVV